ncbi:MAG: acetyl/propionyl/methylcrotonyl-CoA carboxylase subunit alpha [Alphaproteobacteria bacterium]
MTHAITKILIANRGEIAVRIARTLRTLGIRSVALYHAAEADALHAREADEAQEILGATPVAAYLDIAQIVGAAHRAGADAVHPGYGFLSENAEFASAVAGAGLVWIGPPAEAIRLMGHKVTARNFVRDRGFPVAPSAEDDADPRRFHERAAAIGFPLLIKAAAGGGGKGMHIVRSAAELDERIATARREAERYFGNGAVYAERFVEQPRHIEVQILADAHGNVIHLGERECSIQRRFQKIIEEAPSPALTPVLREKICAAAVGIAKAAGYVNAGTVEFILGQDGEFYFLEMNTRLQVEHPVTEAITGLDLVEQQVRVARGEKLRLSQSDVRFLGHAIECRICAEDADADFVPATGRILLLRPPQGPAVRFDSGLLEGQSVTTSFDPMLAKLIVHGADRAQAIARMRAALQNLVLLGVTTNADFLDRVMAQPAFAAGALHTGFIEQHAPALAPAAPAADLVPVLLAAAADADRDFRDLLAHVPEPHASMGAWRN